MLKLEKRTYNVELREENREGTPVLAGYAANFDSPSQDLGGFVETISRGAFSKTILEADVRALFNHDNNFVLGRNKAGTLTMREDNNGLFVEIVPPDTTWARDLMTSVKRGDISQMSFQFQALRDEWNDDHTRRNLKEVKLFDVSLVTFPAYESTSIGVQYRSLEQYIEEAKEVKSKEEIQKLISELTALLEDNAPGEVAHPEADNKRAYRERQLQLLEKEL
jgi:hypothetical protein